MSRQNANRQIVQTLAALVECYPDLRFTQLLFNADVLKTTGIIRPSDGAPEVLNEYHLESDKLLERIKNSPLLEVQYERE